MLHIAKAIYERSSTRHLELGPLPFWSPTRSPGSSEAYLVAIGVVEYFLDDRGAAVHLSPLANCPFSDQTDPPNVRETVPSHGS